MSLNLWEKVKEIFSASWTIAWGPVMAFGMKNTILPGMFLIPRK
jgi:hypothetical protein